MSEYPYIGLRPFQREETEIFFGREEHTDDLLSYLSRQHFLAVIGLSGCGKSSLVKTGLIPNLQAGYLSEAGTHWRIAEMRPGNQPFANLAHALMATEALGESYKSDLLENEILKRGAFSLHELLAIKPLPNKAKLLIVCDQFEEIFRYNQQNANSEAAAFVALLLASAKPYLLPGGELCNDIYVVSTMRSDFLGECALFIDLAEAINAGLYLTPRLNREQLRLAIEEPALVFGGEVEPELVVKLLEDAGNNQDQLPLLQHVLMRLWDLSMQIPPTPFVKGGDDFEKVSPLGKGGLGGILTLVDYQAIGGLADALSRHVDEVYDGLTAEQKRIAEVLFRNLTERGDAQRDTRRPIKLAEIVELTAASFDEVVAVIDAFRQTGRCFLMPPVNVGLNSGSVIDISHESLIRQWQRLKDWTIDEAKSARTYQRLEDRAIGWHKEKVSLLQSPELEFYQQWWREKQPTALWAKRYGDDFDLAEKFLNSSQTAYHQEQQSKNKRRRLIMVSLVSFSIVVTGLAGVSFWQYQKAQQQTEKAKQETLRAAKQQQLAIKQKELALELINQFTYNVPKALDEFPNSAQKRQLTATILKYNIETLDKIYAINPDNKSAREKSINYSKVAEVYAALHEFNTALYYYQLALKLNQQLAKQDPKDIQVQQDMSIYSGGLGNFYLLYLHQPNKALDYYQQAFKINRQLVQQDPKDSDLQLSLYVSLQNLGDVYLKLTQTEKALEYYQQALNINKQLVQQDPKRIVWQQQLATSFEKLSNVYLLLKQNDKASGYQQQALTINQTLTQKAPSQKELAENVVNTMTGYGKVGKINEAIQYYRKGFDIAQKIAQYQNNKLEEIGILKLKGDKQRNIFKQLINTNCSCPCGYNIPQCLILDSGCPKSKKIAQDIINDFNNKKTYSNKEIDENKNREKLESQFELVISYDGEGEGLKAKGDLTGALKSYHSALAILEPIASTYKTNLLYQNTLAKLYSKIGGILKKQNEYKEAIKLYKKLVEINPENDVVWNSLGVMEYKLKSYPEARKVFADALAKFPQDLSLLSNDLELALVQNDMPRFQQRLKTISPLLKPQEEYYVAIPFLNYLANPQSGYQAVIEAIEKLDKKVEITWDFSDVQPTIERQNPKTQKIAHLFIDYFEKRIDLKTLKSKLNTI